MPARTADHRARGVTLPWFPLTGSGAVFLIGCSLLLAWTYRRGHDHVLYVLAAAGLFLVFLAAGFVTIGILAARAALRRQRGPSEGAVIAVQCGREENTGFKRPLAAWGLRCEVSWLAPAVPHSCVRFDGRDEKVQFSRRGHFDRVVRRLTLSDPLGLASLSFCDTSPRQIEVRPAFVEPATLWVPPVTTAAGEEWSAQGKPEGDLSEIGQYRHGDPLRLVLWKVTARRGGNVRYVRRPESAATTRLAYFFMAGDGDDASAELADYLLREGGITANDLFVCSSDDDLSGSDPGEGGRRRLVLSGRVTTTDTAALERFQSRLGQQGAAACIVFVPRIEDAALLRDLALPTYVVSAIRQDGALCIQGPQEVAAS